MKKLIPPLKQSQRDSRWANTFLGYNTAQPYTIGNYGCLITSLANYTGQTPLQVNDTLKANNGFVSGGLLVWSKTPTIGLTETYASPRYESSVPDNALAKIRSLIDQGHPCVVEVDFYPNTVSEDMHWVLVTGYGDGETFYAIDPWTGTEIDLAVYGGIRRTVYSFRAFDKTLAFEGSATPIDDCPAKLTQITAERDRLNGVITGKDELVTNLNQQISQKNATMSTLEVEKKSLADQLSTCQSTSQLHLEQANKAVEYKQQVTHLEEQKAGWIIKEQEYIKQIKTLQTKNENLKKPVQKLILALCEKLGVQI